MVKLKSPKQIAAKIKSLQKEITLLKRAKTSETKAISASKKATRAGAPKRKAKKRRATRKKSTGRKKK